MIDGLPRDSAYGEAIADDESLVDLNANPDEYRPSVREWSLLAELLTAIHSRLGDVLQIQATKNLKLQPWPTPVTAVDRVREKERDRQRERLTDRIEAAKQRYREQALAPASRGFYQDASGRWHRADGRFVSERTVRAATSDPR